MLMKGKYLDPIGKVIISRPNGRSLERRGFMGVDMHSHTVFSDGDSSVKNFIRLAKLRKIGFSITDHNEIKGGVLASKEKKVFHVPGIEVNSRNGRDILLYFYGIRDLSEFYHKYVSKCKIKPFSVVDHSTLKWDEKELIDFAKKYNALISVPHPFGYYARGNYSFYERNSCFKDVQGIEVVNGSESIERNRASFYWAKNSGKAYTGGSDTHTKFGLGRALTVTYAVESLEEYLEQIKKRKSGVIGRELPTGARLKAGFSVFKNLFFRRK